MSNQDNGFEKTNRIKDKKSTLESDKDITINKEKGPISFVTGSLTSGIFAWFSFQISQRLVIYFTLHKPNYSSAFAQSIASGFKTLIIGISFLATFTFTFIGLGLMLVFIKSLFTARNTSND